KSLALKSDGKVLIGGRFSPYLERLNVNGSIDTSFAAVLDGMVRSMIINGDSTILIGGEFASVNQQDQKGIARLLAGGGRDPSFTASVGSTAFNQETGGGYAYVHSIALQPDGKILIAGRFTLVNVTSKSRVARWNASGTLDISFNADPP